MVYCVVEIVETPFGAYFLFYYKEEKRRNMDIKKLNFMSREMMTSDVDRLEHVEEMFIKQKQAGKDIAEEGVKLHSLLEDTIMIPDETPNNGYPISDIDATTQRLRNIKDWGN